MRETPMEEFLVTREGWCVPGTENPSAGAGDDEDGSPGQPRRGLHDGYSGSPANAVGSFCVYGSDGEYLLVCEYSRPEIREPLYRAVRDILDAVDPAS